MLDLILKYLPLVTLVLPVWLYFFTPRMATREQVSAQIGAAIAPVTARLDAIEGTLDGIDRHQQAAREKALGPVLDRLSDIAEGVASLHTHQAVIEERVRAMPGQELALQVASLATSVGHLSEGIRTVTAAVARHDDHFAEAARRAAADAAARAGGGKR